MYSVLKFLLFFALVATAVPTRSYAQDTDATMDAEELKDSSRIKRFFLSQDMDGYILSTTLVEKANQQAKLTTPRFTAWLNIGLHVNYNANDHLGLFAGLTIKNIGFIEKIADTTVKRRVYTIGIPIGVKIGNLTKRNYALIGGGIDFPFHYKEKRFVTRNKKEKFGEWFSDRTEKFMPYVFIGASINPGITLKFQYYPGNFLNKDFYGAVSPLHSFVGYPYANYTKTNLMFLSIGFDIHYKSKPKPSAIDVTEETQPQTL